MNTCVLCSEPLDRYPTNLEHYVHQVLIRNFDKLGVPDRFSWAMRRDERYDLDGDYVIAPISAHRQWATVTVHEKCNLDASHVGQDLRYIIDNLDENIPDYRFKRIILYYAHLWKVDPYKLVVRILDRNEVKYKYSNKKYDIMYAPHLLSCGRIEVEYCSLRRDESEKVMHTIYVGTQDAIEGL